ncbi:MAG: PAC2 family protein [Candidatus Thermoplasmatota archaeon]|nr:PAC2 family protein [Candidatus Thermoplasmatota archaeon]
MINSISVGYGSMSGTPVVAVDDDLNAEDALVVTCFPSAGFVSSIVAHYLVDRLGLTFVGGARGSGLPPVCLVQEGKPLPPLRFYAGEPICHMDRCDKVVLIASEIQVIPDLTLSLADSILDWVESSGAAQLMMIDSFSHGPDQAHSIFDDDDSDESMLGIASTDSAQETLEQLGVAKLKHGVVGGMSGVMLGECRRRRIDAMAILAESGGDLANGAIPDARAAARIIERLDGLLPAIKLDPEPLLEEAQRIEDQIREMMATQLNQLKMNKPGVESSGMYG